MRRLRRPTERLNVVFVAILSEFERGVAAVAIQDEKSISTNPMRFGMLIEVLQPLQTGFTRRSALFTNR